MTRKKSGFLLFIFSLIPGAGEMYLGFFKQGISVMSVFFAIFAGATWLNVGPVMFVLPVLWFYSFFRVHNLASLSDEEFYTIKDDYLFHITDPKLLDLFGGEKGRKFVAVVLILIGVSGIWNILFDGIIRIFDYLQVDTGFVYDTLSRMPQLAFAVLILGLGVYLIKGKKKQLDAIEDQTMNSNREV